MPGGECPRGTDPAVASAGKPASLRPFHRSNPGEGADLYPALSGRVVNTK